jgi:hypothetical protein
MLNIKRATIKANGSGEDSELSLNYVAQMRKRHLTELPLKKESKGLSNEQNDRI